MVTISAQDSIPLNEYARRIFDVRNTLSATVQAVRSFGAWGTAVLTIKRSNDGLRFVALESGVTLTAEGMTAAINTSGFAYLSVETTTLEGSGAYADLYIHAKGDNALG